MSTPNSPVSICSNALLDLGAQSISDFTENTDRAKIVANIYPSARDDLLREHVWKFAIKRTLLAPDADKPAFGYTYAYTLPADFLKAITVNYGYYPDYTIENGKILTNENSIALRYIYQNVDVTTYDAAFIKLLTLMIKSKIAYSVTQSTSLAEAIKQEFIYELRSAKAIDGQQVPPEALGFSTLLEDRLLG